MSISKHIRFGFILILVGIIGAGVMGGFFADTGTEIFAVIAYCSLIVAFCGLGISFVYSLALSGEIRKANNYLEKRRLELVTHIGNVISEYLVDRNSAFVADEKKIFFPIFIKYVPGGMEILLNRKEGIPSEIETKIIEIEVNLSGKIGGSATFSLGIIRDLPQNYFSLSHIDEFFEEVHRIIKAYQLPKK